MWRDILSIAAFVLAGLMYFGLTPRRLSRYAKTAKNQITKKSRYQIVWLILVIAITPVYIFVAIWGLEIEIFGLAASLAMIAILLLLWCFTLIGIWELRLSQRGAKIANVVTVLIYLLVISLLTVDIIPSDMPLWQKFAIPLGGTGIGLGIPVLRKYIRSKHENERPSREGNNDSPL